MRAGGTANSPSSADRGSARCPPLARTVAITGLRTCDPWEPHRPSKHVRPRVMSAHALDRPDRTLEPEAGHRSDHPGVIRLVRRARVRRDLGVLSVGRGCTNGTGPAREGGVRQHGGSRDGATSRLWNERCRNAATTIFAVDGSRSFVLWTIITRRRLRRRGWSRW